MKRNFLFTGSILAIGLMALMFSPRSAEAESGRLVVVHVPEDLPGPPFYARINSETFPFYHDGEWAAVVWYRDPGCVPTDFNLLDFWHFPGPSGPGAFGCSLNIEGFALWNEDLVGTPKVVVSRDSDLVPVWFVPLDAALETLEDDILTVDELAAVDGLRMGAATFFNETLHPKPDGSGQGGHNVFKLIINANGFLENGDRFRLNITRTFDDVRTVHIMFE